MTIYSPMSGIVVHKNALEGKYVETGTRIYTIADLSRVWALVDAYESDLQWIRYGQEIEFTTESYPGETFKGIIAFIDPLLDPKTRTVKIRVNIENPDGKLKPEMFVRAILKSKLATKGKIIDPDLVGKWISPMHPEIVKDHPGKCDVCGMPLVRAESLGYVNAKDVNKKPPVVVPASAPLITGKRAIVYVQVAGQPGTFEGREVELGPRAGDYYLVRSGLSEGERVVVNGNFKIDSAIQIKAGPSMMNPEGGGTVPGHRHDHDQPEHLQQAEADDQSNTSVPKIRQLPETFLETMDRIYIDYFHIQNGFSHDNLEKAKINAKKLLQSLQSAEMKKLPQKVHEVWMQHSEMIKNSSTNISKASQIEDARYSFKKLSESLIILGKNYGSKEHQLLVYHCPMAFDFEGANWIQNKKGVENPYFGSSMFECGTVTEILTENQNHEGHQHE
jgi:Cu(I)/Ag(I) efflux system membrane fusion protein